MPRRDEAGPSDQAVSRRCRDGSGPSAQSAWGGRRARRECTAVTRASRPGRRPGIRPAGGRPDATKGEAQRADRARGAKRRWPGRSVRGGVREGRGVAGAWTGPPAGACSDRQGGDAGREGPSTSRLAGSTSHPHERLEDHAPRLGPRLQPPSDSSTPGVSGVSQRGDRPRITCLGRAWVATEGGAGRSPRHALRGDSRSAGPRSGVGRVPGSGCPETPG